MHVSPSWESTQPVRGPSPPQGGTSGSLLRGGFRTSESADLQIVTADGDKVTISSDRTTSVGYAGFAATSGGSRVRGQALQVSSESSVSLSVEGSLDAEELAHIKRVVKLLGRAASASDATRLLKQLSHAHLESLASVEGSVERTTEFDVARASGSLPAASDTTAPADPMAPQPPPPPPSEPQGQPPQARTASTTVHAGDFLFTILASMLRSPGTSRAA